jgi:hypothetical protein
MIDKNYHENALKTYGESCEICGFRSCLEVHHINYQEHQAAENMLRGFKKARKEIPESVLKGMKTGGWDYFDPKTEQLSKDDSTTNLSVLCGNCHSLMHKLDVGMKLLNVLKERK